LTLSTVLSNSACKRETGFGDTTGGISYVWFVSKKKLKKLQQTNEDLKLTIGQMRK